MTRIARIHPCAILLLLSASLGLFACGSTRAVGDKHFEFNTNYWNGKLRSRFYLNDGAVSDSILLLDKQGKPQLKHKIGGALDFHDLDYSAADDSDKPERSLASINKGMKDFTEYIGMNYRPLFEKGEFDVSFELFMWINAEGTVEHAICLSSAGNPPDVIKSIVDDLEGWRFPSEKGARLKCFARRYNFYVTRHDEYKL